MSDPQPNATKNDFATASRSQSRTLGRYELIAKLGEGGMGTVYKATHLSLKRTVALKVLRREYSANPRFVQRFRREMEAIGRLRHTHVVRATDAGEESGVLFLVMDYEKGATLNRLVAQNGPLRPSDACELTRQAALGLQYIYSQDLVHRDIKPSNLLLTNDGVVKILDLGLARLRSDNDEGPTQSGAVLGTIDYIAPEQVDNARTVDIRADIYSLGCTLFKLLSAKAPFSGEAYDSTAKKLRAHLDIEIQRPAKPTIEDDLWAMIAKMTAKDPSDRYAEPQQVADALLALTLGADPVALIDDTWSDEIFISQWTGTSTTRETAAESSPTAPSELSATVAFNDPAGRLPSLAIAAVSIVAMILALAVGGIVWQSWHMPLADHNGREAIQPRYDVAPLTTPAAKSNETTAVTKPTELILLDELPPLTWHNLFDRQPQVLQWFPDEGLSNWQFDADLDQLEVRTSQRAMFNLGSVTAADYTIQVGIFKSRWNGGSGIYFGYHDVSPTLDENLWPDEIARYQYVNFGEVRGPDGAMISVVQRGIARVSPGPRGLPKISSNTLASAPIDPPLGEKILEVVVVNGQVKRVRLDGVELPKLSAEPINKMAARADHFGSFGTLNVVDDCIFRNARAMIHASE